MGKPLLDVLRDVVLDPAEQAAFTHDPSTYLSQYGYEDVAPDDLSEAFGLVADTLPPDVAQAVASTAPAALPADPSDDLVGDDLGDDVEGSAFGEVTQDFDAVTDDDADSLDDDDLDADFGTGEVTVVDVVDDDAAFGEGFETESPDDGAVDTFEVDDAFTPSLEPDTPDVDVDVPEVHIPEDDYDDDLGGDTDDFDVDDVDLPDDPGDFLDDIGSF